MRAKKATPRSKPQFIIFNRVTYRVNDRQTTSRMREQGYPLAAADFEGRGIGALVFLTRPRGTKLYTGYETLDGRLFSVDTF